MGRQMRLDQYISTYVELTRKEAKEAIRRGLVCVAGTVVKQANCKELEEAAVMDGAGHGIIFFRIILPLSMPAIASASIFNFVSAWNNLLFPLVFISKDSMKTISIGLLSFFGAYTSDYGAVMAAIGVSIIPPIIMYILLQEKMEKGLTAGAVKG